MVATRSARSIRLADLSNCECTRDQLASRTYLNDIRAIKIVHTVRAHNSRLSVHNLTISTLAKVAGK